MKKIGIVTSGLLPVPAASGGAVESLIENVLNKNEEIGNSNFVVFSIYSEKAKDIAIRKNKKKNEYIFIKPFFLSNFIDLLIYYAAKFIFRKKNMMSYRHIIQRLSFLRRVGKTINKDRVDCLVLENHFTEFRTLSYKDNKQIYQGKVIYHAHNLPTFYRKLKTEIKCAEVFFSVSEYMNCEIKSRIKRINPSADFTVLRNGVDHSVFFSIMDESYIQKLKEKYHIPLDKKIVLFAGRLTREKGILELLDAFCKVDDSCYLLIAGNYYFDTKINNYDTALINSYLKKMPHRVAFTGFVPYGSMGEIYNLADFVVLPSIWEDPAPLTVIEALSCGKPLITTNSGGIPEYVSNDCAIVLKKESDLSKQLVESINLLSHDGDRCKKMARAALSVSKSLSLENYFKGFMEIINRI